MEHAGKVALISGAAQGIGAAVARALAAQGARIAALDLHKPELPHALSLCADVADSAQVEAAVQQAERELGPIDILVNAAGILRMAPLLATSDEDWERTFAVNAGGVFRLSRAVARRMVARGTRGAIVTVASNAGAVPRQQMGAYAASKAASCHITRCLGLELAQHGIRCNVVSPGSTDTAMQRQLGVTPQAVIAGAPASYRLGIPLGRLATPEDIAAAVCFLVSDQARHITMHDLRVDGGATLDA